MIFTETVACPYCGVEQTHTCDVTVRNGHAIRAFLVCEKTDNNPHKNGCGLEFVSDWNIMALVKTYRIEGQQELSQTGE